jgi:hypothetical protein
MPLKAAFLFVLLCCSFSAVLRQGPWLCEEADVSAVAAVCAHFFDVACFQVFPCCAKGSGARAKVTLGVAGPKW